MLLKTRPSVLRKCIHAAKTACLQRAAAALCCAERCRTTACEAGSRSDDAAEAGTTTDDAVAQSPAVLDAARAAPRTLAPRRADAVDCLGEAEKAQRFIRTTLAIYADDGDPAPLRPVAKTIAKPDSPFRQCLERAYYLPNDQLDEATRNHARDALEYAASVVEFDAFDRVWKTSQPKQSLTQYTAEGLRGEAGATARRR